MVRVESPGKCGISKMVLALIISVIIVVVAVAGYFVTLSPGPQSATPVKKLKVAVIYTTPIEEPWNTVLHEALTWAKGRYEFEYVYSEKVDTADVERVIREYIAAGYDIIIPHSWGFYETTIKLAKEFPNVAFAQGSGPTDIKYPANIVLYDYWIQDAAYLAGIIAGKMTKTNVVGVVAAYAVPDVNRLVNAFAAGAKSANPKVEVKAIYIESWFDPIKGKDAAKTLIEMGADFIYAERYGPFEAAKEALEKGKKVYCFGNIVDQSTLAPEVVLASVAWDLKTFVAKLIEMKQKGRWEGGIYDWGMKEGWAKLIWNEKLKKEVPKEVLELVEKTEKDIVEGRFKVPVFEDWNPERWK
ncbi:MAG: BMP family protein [Aigarchaeota archaeon]|nr:BMP family protein [Aigarchaeota archaeon]MCX8193654.1 BMP family protein [Nitrososphaeria archaeon]MDW7986986.1 BMP family protein [Nitrososphaerota archaeon]